MRRSAPFYTGLLLLLSFPAVAVRAKDLTVNLKFVPQEGVHSESPDLPPSMLERSYELRVEDGRGAAEAAAIGKGTDDDDHVFAIQAGSDVVAYVQDTLRQVSEGWGLKTAAPKERVLTLKVSRFFVEESNKAVGSMYSSEVKLAWTLSDTNGAKLAEGAGSGSAHRYGRARSGDNCAEVLSDALKEAFSDVLGTSTLQTAWTSGKASVSGAPSGDSKGAVEERLRHLDELLQKGLITKSEYDKKRAEILKDV